MNRPYIVCHCLGRRSAPVDREILEHYSLMCAENRDGTLWLNYKKS